MQVVNITDIEDLILCKHDIDTLLIKNEETETKLTLEEFISKYATTNLNYISNQEIFPFNYIKLYNKQYLFVIESDEDKIKNVQQMLKQIDYDFSKLKKVKNDEVDEGDDMILINNQYYKL